MLCLSIHHKETKENNKYTSLFQLLGVNVDSLGIFLKKFYCEIKCIIYLLIYQMKENAWKYIC